MTASPKQHHIPIEAYQQLLEISRDLAATLDLDALLARIVHAAAALSNAEAASILLYDDKRQALYFQAATNLSNTLQKGVEVPLEGSIAGLALLQGKPIRRQEAQKDPCHYGYLDSVTHFQTRSLIAVPLISQEKPIGVLEALNKRQGAFTDADEELLSVLSAQAAVAIQNTRLFHQSDLVAELVHEIRTPLGAILAAAQMLRLPQLSPEQRAQTIDAIEHEARYLNSLTTSFLDLARLESGRVQFQRRAIDLQQMVAEVVQLFAGQAAERDITITVAIPENLPPLIADPGKLKQVLTNLVSNAVKYNRQGGRIHIAASQRNGSIAIAVSDTGAGIAPEHQERLFQKFYRAPTSETQVSGTGLGLYLSKRIVKAHGGTLSVESKMGEGATFTLILPLGNHGNPHVRQH